MARRITTSVDDVPEGGCTAAGGGLVLLTKVHGVIHAFDNRCLHKAQALDDGVVRDGVLTCPAHFWRYRIDDGSSLNSSGALPRYDVEVEGDTVVVQVPEAPTAPLREQLLDHARTWRRDD